MRGAAKTSGEVVLGRLCASLMLVPLLFSEAGCTSGSPSKAARPPAAGAVQKAPTSPAEAAASAEARSWHMRTGEMIKRTWGVEVLGVRLNSSGWMLTFRYKILDAEKAKVLLDPKATAYLVDEGSGARLAVPAMENIGELRQTKSMGADREYFIMFGNGNQVVRPGAKVDVVIGNFHADGVVVE